MLPPPPSHFSKASPSELSTSTLKRLPSELSTKFHVWIRTRKISAQERTCPSSQAILTPPPIHPLTAWPRSCPLYPLQGLVVWEKCHCVTSRRMSLICFASFSRPFVFFFLVFPEEEEEEEKEKKRDLLLLLLLPFFPLSSSFFFSFSFSPLSSSFFL